MEVRLHASIYDESLSALAQSLHAPFAELGQRLSGPYGGGIEHLWMNIELVESLARPDLKPRHPFRFQKRVSGRSHFGLPAVPDQFNVGHFSVRPDFTLLASLPAAQAICYVLRLMYEASAVLLDKQKKLGGFDAPGFRISFRDECDRIGYPIADNVGSVP
ncbi:MAG: hypothetical protein ACEQSK_09185 [Sphingomonadaceae bacterium]